MAACHRKPRTAPLAGNIVVVDADGASGSAVGAPAGSGNNFALDTASRADYCVEITEAGRYRIDAVTTAADVQSDSFFVQLEGQDPILWHINRAEGFATSFVHVPGDPNPWVVELEPGQYDLTFFQREDSTLLDSFSLVRLAGEPVPCGGLSQEAETGRLGGSIAIQSDAAANGGRAIGVPGTAPNSYSLNDANFAEFCFQVDAGGDYNIVARTVAPDFRSDSFWVSIDGGEPVLWHVTQTTEWASTPVMAAGSPLPRVFTLDAGEHKVTLFARESGTLVDTITLVGT